MVMRSREIRNWVVKIEMYLEVLVLVLFFRSFGFSLR